MAPLEWKRSRSSLSRSRFRTIKRKSLRITRCKEDSSVVLDLGRLRLDWPVWTRRIPTAKMMKTIWRKKETPKGQKHTVKTVLCLVITLCKYRQTSPLLNLHRNNNKRANSTRLLRKKKNRVMMSWTMSRWVNKYKSFKTRMRETITSVIKKRRSPSFRHRRKRSLQTIGSWDRPRHWRKSTSSRSILKYKIMNHY